MTLEILTSDFLTPTLHGFFTRRGGASSGIFHGLNCGPGSTDQSAAVEINRARVAEAMEVAPAALTSLHQIHSTKVITVNAPLDIRPKGDAMVTNTPGMALGILTADCQPVLFHDAKAGVIGAAHAGWRGALSGILEETLTAMEALGASRADTTAIIGPSISQCAYEVGPEFLDEFLVDNPDNSRFFANGTGDRMLFDLQGFSLHRLRSAGIGHSEWTRHCTYSDAERFYSFRRTTHAGEADYGRLISTIRL